MTNYNERLDELFHDLYLAGWNDKLLDDSPTAVPSENQEKRKAKQSITSLIKELVAEAKPFDYVPEGHQPEACLNHEKYTSACCGCRNQRARVHALDEFEQNLLKALEEV